MGKILRVSLKLNFTPNTLGCYGLTIEAVENATFQSESTFPPIFFFCKVNPLLLFSWAVCFIFRNKNLNEGPVPDWIGPGEPMGPSNWLCSEPVWKGPCWTTGGNRWGRGTCNAFEPDGKIKDLGPVANPFHYCLFSLIFIKKISSLFLTARST